MRYFFKPWTHWHEITASAYECLKAAGYGPDHLKVRRPNPID